MTQLPIPVQADDITAEWMQQALAAGGLSDFPELDALEIKEISDENNMMGHVYRCRMTACGNIALHPAAVVVKLPTSKITVRKFANWMSLYHREFVFYSDIALHSHIRVPSVFYCDFDARSQGFVLVMEDLGNMKELPNMEGAGVMRARRAIAEIAELQGQFWEAADAPALGNCNAFMSAKEGYLMQLIYLLILPITLNRFDDLFTTDMRRLAEKFGSRIGAYYAALNSGPKTIVHGDYRLGNVLFGDEGQIDFVVIDWQGAGLGCGMYDVAFFLSFSVTVDDRRRIERDAIGEYHDTLCRMGVKNYSRDDCWRSYRQSMLGTLIPMVIGAGSINMSSRALEINTIESLGRTLTAIDDLDAWEFLPTGERLFSFSGALSMTSRCVYSIYSRLLNLRKGK